MTVIVTPVRFTPEAAVTTAVPPARALTLPSAATVATAASLVLQVILAATVRPELSRGSAAKCSVAPTASVAAAGETTMVSSGAARFDELGVGDSGAAATTPGPVGRAEFWHAAATATNNTLSSCTAARQGYALRRESRPTKS